MEILRARTAGFCMGVALALRHLDKAVLEHDKGQVATFGPIIHNPQVLEEYSAMGVSCIHTPDEAKAEQCIVLRAHGLPRQQEALLRQQGADVVDATCPKVKKAQLAIAEATKNGASLLLYGETEHPEVAGLISYAAGPYQVFAQPEDCPKVLPGVEKVVLAAQTTQDRQIFVQLQQDLEQCWGKNLAVLDTICDATRGRQAETLALAAQVDIVLVIGGKQSGNTRRLAEVAAATGKPTLHVERPEELQAEFFHGKTKVGLTAGASTPKALIDEVERVLLSF